MTNSDKRGFLLTDDTELATQCAVYDGSYEDVTVKHVTVPGPEVCADLLSRIPNYSARMSAVSTAVIPPQIPTLD